MVKPTRSLDPFWLKENTMVRVDPSARTSGTRRPRADDEGPSIPLRQYIPHGVPLETLTVAEDDSHAQFDRMSNFYMMQDMYAHFGLSGRYLTHRVDTWATAHRFRYHFSRDPPTPYYGHYQYPVASSSAATTTYSTQSARIDVHIFTFVHGNQGADASTFIDFDADMQDKDGDDDV
ncbi:hypothetical protein KIW84_075151 [Lathyrus oleraceus]|uniref:Uncharacterized protein n=1 Tax=Pisum sativum TaxID=3888 RepID=A0A9D4VT03_PEA|nr:hypothetical protein KIW84_075151 [Pisum sativum]